MKGIIFHGALPLLSLLGSVALIKKSSKKTEHDQTKLENKVLKLETGFDQQKKLLETLRDQMSELAVPSKALEQFMQKYNINENHNIEAIEQGLQVSPEEVKEVSELKKVVSEFGKQKPDETKKA
jgi:hypothetical protein